MYKHPGIYYFSIVFDLILRAVWAATLGINTGDASFSNNMTTISAVTEVIRRFTWNIYRLEVCFLSL
jgi:hypothetical protein